MSHPRDAVVPNIFRRLVVVLVLAMIPRPSTAFSTTLRLQPWHQIRPFPKTSSSSSALRMQTMGNDDPNENEKKFPAVPNDVRLRRVWTLGTRAVRADTLAAALAPQTARLREAAAASLFAAAAAGAGLEINGVPIAESLLALAAGVGTVAVATAAVDELTSASIPPFDTATQRFDQTSFSGRYCQMIMACDPRLLLYTREQVQQCQSLVEHHLSMEVSDRELWNAKRIVDSALHPTTRAWTPRAFRMSGYLPFNGPICIAMVAFSQSTLALLFLSWLNQSQNALVNYFNANQQSNTKNLLQSYAVAVGSALAVVFGLCNFIQGHYSGEEAKEVLRFVSFPSAVVASSLNCYIVRRPEIRSGIPILDDQLKPVLQGETSQAAAQRAVYSTTASRAVLQMPTYFIPPFILETVTPIKEYLINHPPATVPVTTYLLLVSFGIGLPAAVGLFGQISKIEAVSTERKFQTLTDPTTGQPYTSFYFNKGL